MAGLRRKVLRISDQAWPLFLGEGSIPAEVIEGGLPGDARAVAATHDGYTTSIVFESESFEEVAEGESYPVIPMMFLTIATGPPGGGVQA